MTQASNPMPDNSAEAVYQRSVPWITHSIVSVVILVVAVGVVASLFGSKPKAGRWGGARPVPSVAVDTKSLQPESYLVWVDSYGTAEALTRTQLVSEVNGRVIAVSANIRAGKSFKRGDVLVTLDDRDFKVEVDIAASAAADAELLYLQEVAEAELAAKEWNERPTNEAARQLTLRKPQVAAAQASLQAARARLDRAKLNLERTRITAPFDGMVLTQTVDVGQVVSPSQAIAEIYSTDVVEVRLPVKINDLQHVQLPEQGSDALTPSRVVLESDMGNKTYQWQGEIVRTEGAFDTATRQLFVVAQVKRPFEASAERPAMRVGQFVRAKIEGRRYDDVFVIPRRAISQDFLVSLDVDGVLKKRRVAPIWTDSDAVIVEALPVNLDAASMSVDDPVPYSGGLKIADTLILTPTANMPDGTRVKPLGETDAPRRGRNVVASKEPQAKSESSEAKSASAKPAGRPDSTAALSPASK